MLVFISFQLKPSLRNQMSFQIFVFFVFRFVAALRPIGPKRWCDHPNALSFNFEKKNQIESEIGVWLINHSAFFTCLHKLQDTPAHSLFLLNKFNLSTLHQSMKSRRSFLTCFPSFNNRNAPTAHLFPFLPSFSSFQKSTWHLLSSLVFLLASLTESWFCSQPHPSIVKSFTRGEGGWVGWFD